MNKSFKSLLGGLVLTAATLSSAQQAVPIFGLVELSGAGATSGTNFDNGIKGYSGMYIVKAVTEKVGKFDAKAFAAAMKGITLTVKDQHGDLDRDSYMTKAEGGKQVVSAILPPVNKK